MEVFPWATVAVDISVTFVGTAAAVHTEEEEEFTSTTVPTRGTFESCWSQTHLKSGNLNVPEGRTEVSVQENTLSDVKNVWNQQGADDERRPGQHVRL